MSRVIIVSNRLPVSIVEDDSGIRLERSLGGLATALSAVLRKHDAVWVGWPGNRTRLTKSQLAQLKFPSKLLPVPLSGRLLHHYYDRMTNSVLWPVMHGLAPEREPTEGDWQALREVTGRFATAIKQICRPDDVIWVHDYHLVLLPRLLREAGITNRIGFFLHTPFPPDKVFMRWPQHSILLRDLSDADLIGFQTPRDVMNFRICLAASGMTLHPGAQIAAFPIGVDYGSYQRAHGAAEARRRISLIRKKIAGKQAILSVSRLDYTKGIINQLRAVEQLLENHPHPHKLIYKLVVAPSRENVGEYKRLKQSIDQTVHDINKRFAAQGFVPVDYAYRSHGFHETNAWYRSADVLLVMPGIDGMNLVVKEYIAARGNRPGAIVLSETAGAAFQLSQAELADPNGITAIAASLQSALSMSVQTKRERWAALLDSTKRQDIFWWADSFLDRLSVNTG